MRNHLHLFMGRRADGGRQGVRAQSVYMVFLGHLVCLQNKKGNKHRSEAEPVPVPLRIKPMRQGGDWFGPILSLRRFLLSQTCRPSKFCPALIVFPQRGSASPLWRLATVTRFLSGSFSPLAAICRRRPRTVLPNTLFVHRFSCAHSHAWLASHSQ